MLVSVPATIITSACLYNEKTEYCYEFKLVYIKSRSLGLQNYELVHDGGLYHLETSPLISAANQWTGFYMTGTSVMKKLLNVGRQV